MTPGSIVPGTRSATATATNSDIQQSSNTKTPKPSDHQQKDKVKKIIKFEKIMNMFCKDIGLDKKSLLYLLLGGAEGGPNPNEMSDRKDNKMYQSIGND